MPLSDAIKLADGTVAEAAAHLAGVSVKRADGWMDQLKGYMPTSEQLQKLPSAAMKNPALGAALGAGVGGLGMGAAGYLQGKRDKQLRNAMLAGALGGGALGAIPGAVGMFGQSASTPAESPEEQAASFMRQSWPMRQLTRLGLSEEVAKHVPDWKRDFAVGPSISDITPEGANAGVVQNLKTPAEIGGLWGIQHKAPALALAANLGHDARKAYLNRQLKDPRELLVGLRDMKDVPGSSQAATNIEQQFKPTVWGNRTRVQNLNAQMVHTEPGNVFLRKPGAGTASRGVYTHPGSHHVIDRELLQAARQRGRELLGEAGAHANKGRFLPRHGRAVTLTRYGLPLLMQLLGL